MSSGLTNVEPARRSSSRQGYSGRFTLMLRTMRVQRAPAHVTFLQNPDVLCYCTWAHALVGEPVSTSPGHALEAYACLRAQPNVVPQVATAADRDSATCPISLDGR